LVHRLFHYLPTFCWFSNILLTHLHKLILKFLFSFQMFSRWTKMLWHFSLCFWWIYFVFSRIETLFKALHIDYPNSVFPSYHCRWSTCPHTTGHTEIFIQRGGIPTSCTQWLKQWSCRQASQYRGMARRAICIVSKSYNVIQAAKSNVGVFGRRLMWLYPNHGMRHHISHHLITY
jgi:hypothetical protein